MRFTVQYIPLNQIKPDGTTKISQHIKQLRRLMWDCMHLLAVRKNRKDGTYTVISGHDRYEYLTKHTNKKYAPCLIDESKAAAGMKRLFRRGGIRGFSQQYPSVTAEQITPVSWSILRAFMKQEPRFSRLSRARQLKLIFMALRYKKTIIASMKSQVDKMMSSE